jgi:oxygen-independent coproporphyrinogen-3 oxidase
VDNRDQQGAFVDRLIDELRVLAPHAGPLQTVFVGGGTPSLLRIDLWQRLLRALDDLFDLSIIRREWKPEHADPWRPVECGEFTVECNPESATPDLLATLRAGGVNRVSIGAQSFIDRHLKTLERWHNPDNVARAVESARRAGIPRQSIDLIFAIPGQTLDEWDSDLRRALDLNTTHLSCYSLTYEPNTAMTRRLKLAEFTPCPEELEADMFRHTLSTLRGAGLERYEVSNFARPGHESRHNIAYWIQAPWLAAGPSASGHVLNPSQESPERKLGSPEPRREKRAAEPPTSWRFKNVPRLGDYLNSTGLSPATEVEPPDPLRLIRERIMMGLRLEAGLEIAPILAGLQSLSPVSAARLDRTARAQSELGNLTLSPTRWTLTDDGFLHADGIAAALMDAVRG